MLRRRTCDSRAYINIHQPACILQGSHTSLVIQSKYMIVQFTLLRIAARAVVPSAICRNGEQETQFNPIYIAFCRMIYSPYTDVLKCGLLVSTFQFLITYSLVSQQHLLNVYKFNVLGPHHSKASAIFDSITVRVPNVIRKGRLYRSRRT